MTDTLLEQIKADREIGTPGPWEVPDQTWTQNLTVTTAGGLDAVMIGCPGTGGAMSYTDEVCTLSWKDDHEWLANARRIARVPDLEARILRDAETIKAAEALADVLQAADNAVVWESLGFGNTFSDRVEKTLAAFRAAQEKNDE